MYMFDVSNILKFKKLKMKSFLQICILITQSSCPHLALIYPLLEELS